MPVPLPNKPLIASSPTQQIVLFGIIFLVGSFLAVFPFATMHVGMYTLSVLIDDIVPANEHKLFTIILFAFALISFSYLPCRYAGFRARAAATGLLGGLILCVLSNILMAFGISMSQTHLVSHKTFGQLWLACYAGDWIYLLLAILTVCILYLVPLRPWFASGLVFPIQDDVEAQPEEKPVSKQQAVFSFNTSRQVSPLNLNIRSVQSQKDNTNLNPPVGFIPAKPLEGIVGLISIPSNVICRSVPEAEAFLLPDIPVRIRLSYLIPQLHNATVWLLWQQVFQNSPDDPNYGHGTDRPDEQLQGRWIRLTPRDYVLQIPREHFNTEKVTPPVWTQRPAVPQEAQFESMEEQNGVD